MQAATGKGLAIGQNRFSSRTHVLQHYQRRVPITHPTYRTLKVAAALGGARVEVSEVKADIAKLAGDKYGLDRQVLTVPYAWPTFDHLCLQWGQCL